MSLSDTINQTVATNRALSEEWGISKTIYAWVMPETRAVLDRVLDENRAGLHDMYTESWTQKQDAFHNAFFDRWEEWASPVVTVDKTVFANRYPMNGASEALDKLISEYGNRARKQRFKPTIHVFAGEYEGFKSLAEAAYIPVKSHLRSQWQKAIDKIGPNDQVYISQPSAFDGNVWADYDAFMTALAKKQPTAQVVVDLTYVGAIARDFKVATDHPNIQAVVFSLSKPFGVYYHRIGGVYTREPYGNMFGNKWFKNLLSLRLGTALMNTYGVHELATKYRPLQEQVAANVSQKLGLTLAPCDVFLLAATRAPKTMPQGIPDLVRGKGNDAIIRACLTPGMHNTLVAA